MKKFIQEHIHILAFGALQIFFSAPGQTFLIALFVESIFEEMGVSRSYFAGMYSTATLCAALLLNPAGRLIDKYPMRNIIKVVASLMAIGCFALASAQSLIFVFIGFFLLRLLGQGIFTLTASTLMVKSFEKNRGKSLGIVTQGFPLSEAVYPSIAFFLITTVGWRMGYILFGISNIIILLPIQLYLLKKAHLEHGTFFPGEVVVNPQRLRGNPEARKIRAHRDFTLKETVKDIKFYLLIAASCLPPMVVTGLFWHMHTLFEANQWTISLSATAFIVYAICKSLSSFWIGGVIDKHGPLYPFIVMILLLGAGTYLAARGGSHWIIFSYFLLLGGALGFSSPVGNVVWPHFYGTKHIGSIKGLVATFRNGLTALGPLPIAMVLDSGISINRVLNLLSIGICLMAIVPIIVWELDRKVQENESGV